jgi:hypothetical protein
LTRCGIKFEFFTDAGHFKMDYSDYCKNEDLMRAVQDKRRVFMNLGLRIFSFDREWLEQHPAQKKFVESVRAEYEANPLRFFLPHCAGSENFDTPNHRFINDAGNIYTAMLAGNRFGKSTSAIVKALLTFAVIPTDPEWECFKDHGIIHRPWTGPKEIGVASYNWDNIDETVWPQVVRAWVPRNELQHYAEYSAPKKTAFAVKLKCGSVIHFKCLGQPQGAFESQALDGWIWDEQGTEEKFDGANARLRTTRAYSVGDDGYEYLAAGWHTCGATPHKVDGRSDTGAGTWFESLYTGRLTKGLTNAFYSGDIIKDVPDWVYSEREKKVALAELEEADTTNNKKAVRAIRSRLYGEFEVTGGRVYDEWDDDVHIIRDIEIQPDWCAFRCGDHGRTNPTAFLWVAITPDNDYILYREYEGRDVISDNVARVVRMSGNTLVDDGASREGMSLISRFKETVGEADSEQYIFDVMDGRSFRSPDANTRLTLGDLYRMSGLNRLRPAPLQQLESTIPIVKELLKVDPSRKHIITGKMGAPRLYVMSNCGGFISHIRNYRNKETKAKDGNPSEKPQEKDDHDLDALRYGFMMKPRFSRIRPLKPLSQKAKATGNGYRVKEDKDERNSRGLKRSRRDPITGY